MFYIDSIVCLCHTAPYVPQLMHFPPPFFSPFFFTPCSFLLFLPFVSFLFFFPSFLLLLFLRSNLLILPFFVRPSPPLHFLSFTSSVLFLSPFLFSSFSFRAQLPALPLFVLLFFCSFRHLSCHLFPPSFPLKQFSQT